MRRAAGVVGYRGGSWWSRARSRWATSGEECAVRAWLVRAGVVWATAWTGGGVAADSASLRGVKGFAVHGGEWVVRDGVLWAGGGSGPKLVAARGELGDGSAAVEVFFGDA